MWEFQWEKKTTSQAKLNDTFPCISRLSQSVFEQLLPT